MSEIFLASLLKYFHFPLKDCTHRTFPNSGSFGMFRKVREIRSRAKSEHERLKCIISDFKRHLDST